MKKFWKWMKREWLREIAGAIAGAVLAYILLKVFGSKVEFVAFVILIAASIAGSVLWRGVLYTMLGPKPEEPAT